jgi:hypothetical protein
VTTSIKKEYACRSQYTYTSVIVYEYCFNGEPFQSSRICPGDYGIGQKSYAEKINSRFPEGSIVKELVNPRNPSYSVLEYGVSPLSYISILVGLILTMFVYAM